ncbi:hypothetical protein MRX96_058329 [Rhipicephalus microplus]
MIASRNDVSKQMNIPDVLETSFVSLVEMVRTLPDREHLKRETSGGNRASSAAWLVAVADRQDEQHTSETGAESGVPRQPPQQRQCGEARLSTE